MFRLIANFILFQGAWFAAVLLPPPWASAAAATALALHFRFIAVKGEWRLILAAAVLGGGLDSALAYSGVFMFSAADTPWHAAIAPPWLILLWANFAATLCHSLRWMQRRTFIAGIAGGIAGPAAYLGGSAISDKLTITAEQPTFIIISALCWATLCVLLPRLAIYFTAQSAANQQSPPQEG